MAISESPHHVDPDIAAAQLVRESLAHNVSQLLSADPVVRSGDDSEGVHRMRVAARRLRAELRLLQPALREKPTTKLRTELRWLGRTLGVARDLDTVAPYLTSPSGRDLDDPHRAHLAASLERDSREAQREVKQLLRSTRYEQLMTSLMGYAITPPLRKLAKVPARGIVMPQLRDLARTLEQHVNDLGEDSTLSGIHRVRILGKQLRYGASLAVRFEGAPAGALADALGELQDSLGEMRDAQRALDLLTRLRDGSDGALDDLERSCREAVALQHTQWKTHFDAARSLLLERQWLVT